jgi:hypothetical protein
MSAAAILSVAARTAASEGKKVGAAALTLVALVVMSVTAFPGLTRGPADLSAEGPVVSGSTDTTNQGSNPTVTPTPNTDMPAEPDNTISAEPADTSVSPTPSPSAKTQKDKIAAVLEAPNLTGIINSDSTSKVFAVDQAYTVVGDNGLTANFTFNPTSDAVFTDVLVEVEIDGFIFEFEPVNRELITGKNQDNLEVYLLIGDATYLFDEFGQKWSKSDLGKSRVVIEVVMAANGTTVNSVKLRLFSQ